MASQRDSHEEVGEDSPDKGTGPGVPPLEEAGADVELDVLSKAWPQQHKILSGWEWGPE